ncbi:hypothetical protein N7G274_006873 [Stereocaulon virgatum]|uniref:Altered inheritance of mitochondria protein 41 n=1 Tax=Stereocaulon virgatum TaxID=373712 RepID=A0ABR4A3J0_9LECA
MLLARSRYKPIRLLSQYSSSSTSPAPATAPLLVKIRNDLKAAMKAKDSSRLDVLRGLISEVTNAAKTSNPIVTDLQMVNMIRKRVKSSEAASEEFQNAKREDLKAREVAQIGVLQEYLPSRSLSEEDLTTMIQDVIGRMRTEGKDVRLGSVMKALVADSGGLNGQSVDMRNVSRLVNAMI